MVKWFNRGCLSGIFPGGIFNNGIDLAEGENTFFNRIKMSIKNSRKILLNSSNVNPLTTGQTLFEHREHSPSNFF
jgi:hypothetical protein